jgi:hypothetical protein
LRGRKKSLGTIGVEKTTEKNKTNTAKKKYLTGENEKNPAHWHKEIATHII